MELETMKNQTIDGVPRELLERVLYDPSPRVQEQALDELRALLDREVITDDHLRQRIAFLTSEVHARANERDAALIELKLAQPQGEPVAWMYKRKDQSEFGKPTQHIAFASTDLDGCRTGKIVEGRVILTPRDDYFDWKPLYAERPAPVAATDPEIYWGQHEQGIRDIFKFEGLKGVVYEVLRNPVVMHKVGMYGQAFDGPSTRRAYRYTHQPGNVAASQIGNALARAKMGGDSIDAGLSLLKELECGGFGVYEL
jgi:hypothetical protein